MGAAFGWDFSKVQVHADDRANAAASAQGALAYTRGNDIVFAQQNFAPSTRDGRRLLAHELAHVVQQSSLSDPYTAAAGTSSPHDATEVEASRAASAVVDGRRPDVRARLTSAPPLQCEKQAAPAAPATMSIANVSGPTAADCGSFSYKVNFTLPSASPAGGYFVQDLTIRRAATDCADAPMAGSNLAYHYWESWHVRPGGTQDELVANGTFNFADQYQLDAPGLNSKGTFSYTGSVRYYEGLALPATFIANNPATIARDLPSTTTDPRLPGGTPALAHNLRGRWNCCPVGATPAAAHPTEFT